MKQSLRRFRTILTKPVNKFQALSLKKKIIVIVGIIIVLMITTNSISALTSPPPYTTQKSAKGNITEYVVEAGTIIASGRTDVYSPTDGIVTQTFVANGDTVSEGDELFEVKSTATDQEAQAAYANYLSAVSNLNAAQSSANTLRADMYAKWDTFRNLATNSTYEKGDDSPHTENRLAAEFQIAQDQWVAAEKKYKDQQTTIAQANAQVASARALHQATQDAVVTAPIGGVVSNLSVNNGGTVAIKSMSLTAASTPALVISEGTNNEALIRLSETDITKVTTGQQAHITINAIDNKQFRGRVSRVDTIGTDTQGVVTYNAYITILDSDHNIRPGMTVDAEIVTNELTDVVFVPNSAVKPYQGGRAVRVPDLSAPEKFRYIPVEIGVKGNDKTEIKKGIEVGQEVITSIANESIRRPGPFGN